MKLENFQRVASFLRAQGIEPGLDMLRLEPNEWRKLLNLAKEWENSVSDHRQPEMSEQELAEEKRLEDEKNLFHSCG